MSRKLLVVYNTCGISGIEQIPYYVNAVQSLLFQTISDTFGNDYKIAISGCLNSDSCQRQMQQSFGNYISYNYIEQNLPLSVTFNDTVEQCIKHFGEFEGYLYVDSGISFWDPCRRYDALALLWNIYKSGPYCIAATMPSNDDGRQWWGLQYDADKEFIYPVGKATNMHCQIFSEDWRQAYKRILPDIFASNCMESVFSVMASAIHRRYMLTPKVHLLHNHSMDGASIGSRQLDPDRHPMSKSFPTGGMLFKTTKDMDARYAEGRPLGFGFEECAEYWKHDLSKFDEQGFAKDPELKNFLAREMYLNDSEFDYSTIKRNFTPGH